MVKREMRNQYEYELGLLTGMNEAIMNQNDQMRERILQQNAKIQEVKFLRFLATFKPKITVHKNITTVFYPKTLN